jgi:hypothetical protein
MIALPVGDRSVGNERAGFRSARAFEPIVGYLMPPATPDQPCDATAIRGISGVLGPRERTIVPHVRSERRI